MLVLKCDVIGNSQWQLVLRFIPVKAFLYLRVRLRVQCEQRVSRQVLVQAHTLRRVALLQIERILQKHNSQQKAKDGYQDRCLENSSKSGSI